MTELKPCPFCGSDQIEIKIDEYAPEGHKVDWWMIHCLSCSAEYRNIHCDREGVLDGWNRRVVIDHTVDPKASFGDLSDDVKDIVDKSFKKAGVGRF